MLVRPSIFILISLFLFTSIQAQIFSTAEGGAWSDTLTWTNHVVPKEGNTVTIWGPVVGSGECYDLINNYSIKQANIEIHGNLYNHGGIVDRDGDDTWGSTQLIVHGNITNTEQININRLYLKGDDGHVHTITNPDSAIFSVDYFENADFNRCYLMPVGDVTLQFTTMDFGEESKIELAEDYELTLLGCTLYYSMIYGQNMNIVNFEQDSRLVHRAKLEDITLKGEVNLDAYTQYSARITGTVVNEGIIQDNLFGASTKLLVEGELINKGVIKDNDKSATEDYRYLEVDLKTDLINYGTWKNGRVTISGNSDQIFYLYNGLEVKYIDISDTLGAIIAGTNLEFTNTKFDGNYAKFIMGGKQFTTHGEDSYLYRSKLYDADLNGSLQVSYYNEFYGNTVNTDTIHLSGNNTAIDLFGSFTNNGVIINSPGLDNAGSLTTKVHGNITNNGTWDNYRLDLDSDADQTIATSRPISARYFSDLDTSGTVYASSDLMFSDCTIDMNGGRIDLTEDYSFTYTGTDPANMPYLYDASLILHGNDIRMNENSYLTTVKLADPTIRGIVSTQYSCEFEGRVTVMDTLRNAKSGSSTLLLDGKLFNHGVIFSSPDGGSLTIETKGDIINNGLFDNYVTSLTGTDYDQTVLIANNNNIRSTVRMHANRGSSYNWYKDGEVLNKTYLYLQLDSLSAAEFGEYQCLTNDGWSRKIFVMDESLDIDFTADSTTVVIGDTLMFSPIVDGYVDSIKWDFGDFTYSSEKYPLKSYLAEGDYTVTLNVSNGITEEQLTKQAYITVVEDGISQIEDVDIPENYALGQNYPNPFNPATVIQFQLPEMGFVKLIIFDVLGREIAVLVNEEKSAGTYQIQFNAENLSSGTYIYKIQMNDFSETRKMLMLK